MGDVTATLGELAATFGVATLGDNEREFFTGEGTSTGASLEAGAFFADAGSGLSALVTFLAEDGTTSSSMGARSLFFTLAGVRLGLADDVSDLTEALSVSVTLTDPMLLRLRRERVDTTDSSSLSIAV